VVCLSRRTTRVGIQQRVGNQSLLLSPPGEQAVGIYLERRPAAGRFLIAAAGRCLRACCGPVSHAAQRDSWLALGCQGSRCACSHARLRAQTRRERVEAPGCSGARTGRRSRGHVCAAGFRGPCCGVCAKHGGSSMVCRKQDSAGPAFDPPYPSSPSPPPPTPRAVVKRGRGLGVKRALHGSGSVGRERSSRASDARIGSRV
jgi:hypothetical protein